MHLQVLKFAMARSITWRILLIAVLNSFCQSSSSPPGGLRKGVVGPVPMKPLSPMELSARRVSVRPRSSKAFASWVLPGSGSEVQQITGQVANELMRVACGLVLAGVQLGRIRPGPGRTQRSVHHTDPSVHLLGKIGDELLEYLCDDSFQIPDRPGDGRLIDKQQLAD